MQPNQQQGQQQQVFNQQHHDAYNALREIAMKFHMMGVPGMDQALNGINGAHAKAVGSSRMATPGGYNPMQQAGQMVGQAAGAIGQGVGQAASGAIGNIMGNGIEGSQADQPGVTNYVNPQTAQAQRAIQKGDIPAAFQAFMQNIMNSNFQPTKFQ
jgi:hypothetical protein